MSGEQVTNVVAIRGNAVPALRQPNPHLVEQLRKLLEMAEAGDICSAAVGYCYADGCIGWGTSFGGNHRQLVGALEIAKTYVVDRVRAET